MCLSRAPKAPHITEGGVGLVHGEDVVIGHFFLADSHGFVRLLALMVNNDQQESMDSFIQDVGVIVGEVQ
jgi:hypothetical protein